MPGKVGGGKWRKERKEREGRLNRNKVQKLSHRVEQGTTGKKGWKVEGVLEGQDRGSPGLRCLPCQGPAGALGRQRTPTSTAWSWPHCGPATEVLGARRAMGWALQETQTLHAGGRGIWNQPTDAHKSQTEGYGGAGKGQDAQQQLWMHRGLPI